MQINYYSVIEDLKTLAPRMVISFTDKKKAENHAWLLNIGPGTNYIVVPSEINLSMPVKESTNGS